MREPGAILLVACYELGHQPLTVAWAAAFLSARGYAPAVMDVSVEPFDPEKATPRAPRRRVRAHAHGAPGRDRGDRAGARRESRRCHVAAWGLYAQLNADYLLAHGVDSVIGGEAEGALVALAEALEADTGAPVPGVRTTARPAAPVLSRLGFPVPSRAALPSLKQYARLERDGRHELVGYVEASRGCKHLCRHCPIPPVYGGRFFVVPPDVVMADVRQCVEAGATHVTFGDPGLPERPRPRAGRGPGPPRRVPARDLRRHGEGRAPPAAPRHAAGAPDARLRVRGVGGGVAQRYRAPPPRQGPHAGGRRRARPADARGRHPAPAHLGGVHAVDDARGLPGHAGLRRRGRPGGLGRSRSSTRSGSWCRRARSWSITRRCARTSAPWSSGRSPTRWTHPDPRMDALQAEVARIVEAAAEAHADDAATFDQVWRAAGIGTAGRRPVERVAPDRPRPPRLTEPWFC